MNRYLQAIIVLTTLCGGRLEAQTIGTAPRLVVSITIDQLRTDYIEQFSAMYGEGGLRRLIEQGRVYEAAGYPFSPVDRASAVATIVTGTCPQYNNITCSQWLDRSTLRPVSCTDDADYGISPQRIATSTIGDELKVATSGIALVHSVAADKETAVIASGHAADGAYWLNESAGRWATSSYYGTSAQNMVRAYNSTRKGLTGNDAVADFAEACIADLGMGIDATTDMLFVGLSARCDDADGLQGDIELTYLRLDKALERLLTSIEQRIGESQVLFVVTSTGYTDERPVDYERYRIPTGTFYINRTANLLNMYLGALFGHGTYVEACYKNQIYINRKLLEQRHIAFDDVMARSKELLSQASGVTAVTLSPYNTAVSGDLVVEVAPGWQLVNEDTGEQYVSRAAFVPFPIILYGAEIKPGRVTTEATTDRIAPTIAKAIRIRAPNACVVAPLQ